MTVLAGSLADLDLVSLADVTSLGRSCLRLEVTGSDGALVGYLVLKAGRVVSASAGALHGRNALHVILNSAATARFRLLREPHEQPLAAPLASVDELIELSRVHPRLARATGAPEAAAQSRPYAVPMPAPRGDSGASEATRQGVFRRPQRPTGASGAVAMPRPPLLAQGTGARIRMMEGRLDEFDLATLLQVLGLGRSCIELEILDEAGSAVGAVWVKAGKLVFARAGNIEGMAAIAELLAARDGFQFAAFRLDADLASANALADLEHVLASHPAPRSKARSARASAVPAPRALIMEGSLADFDVPTLLQTVAVGRQYCELELGRDGSALGSVRIKAGMVLSASAGDVTGQPALRRLVGLAAPHWFRLHRLAEALDSTPPLGSLHQLLLATVAPARSDLSERDEEDFDAPTQADGPRRAPAPVPTAFTRETRRALPESLDAAAPAQELEAVRAEPPRAEPPRRATVKSLPPAPRVAAGVSGGEALVPLLDGTLSDFDLRTLLEVLAVTRQHSRLVLLDGAGLEVGELRMKAGYVLSVRHAGKEGSEALALMLALPRIYRFRVLSDLQAVSGEWVDSIANLLAAATVRNTDKPERPTRFLWAAIPISFAIGGAIVFWLARGDAPRAKPPAPVTPSSVVAPSKSAPSASAPQPAARPSQSVPANDTRAPTDEPANDTRAPVDVPADGARAPAGTAGEPADAPPPPAANPTAERGTAPPTAAPEDSSEAMVGMSVRNAQNALRRLGYDPGPIDNRYGKRTRAAIVQFQRTHRLPQTGHLDRETWSGIVAELTAR